MMGNYAFLVKQNQGVQAAVPIYREAFARAQASLGAESTGAAQALTELAWAEMDLGEHDTALTHLSEALRIRRKLFGALHPTVGLAQHNLGRAYQRLKQYDLAEPLLLESYSIFTSEKASNPTKAAAIATALVQLYTDWGREGDAKAWADKQNREQNPSAD